MLRQDYHFAHDRHSSTTDAGLLGLEAEIAATPTWRLLNMADDLTGLPEPLATIARPRLRLTVRELHRRQLIGGTR